MKTCGIKSEERMKTWLILYRLFDANKIEPITPLDMAVAIRIAASYSLDYFDSLISAQCIIRNAKPLTTDDEIIKVVSKRDQILSTLRKQNIIF